MDEQRSLHAEIDYSRKDATRHIVTPSQGSNTSSLRQKLLRNLEGVRKNKPILRSEMGSIKSIQSRQSNLSGRASMANVSPMNNEGRLSKIEEAEGEPRKCDTCQNEITEEEDLAMCEDISRNIAGEEHVKVAYNEFRRRKDVP